MKYYKVEGKNEEEILAQVETQYNLKKEDIFYRIEEKNGGLFKGKKIVASVLPKEEIKNYIFDFFEKLESAMGFSIETKVENPSDNLFKITIDTEDNAILIGKEGKNLRALQKILKQAIVSRTDFNVKINLEIGDYKEQKLKRIESLTRKLAQEVIRTKVDVKMDSMNSYERRFVHNLISEYTMLTTQSEGEEPNRYVVIKYKDKN